MREPSVSAGVVAGLRDYAARRGVSAEVLMSRSGFDAVSLVDPDARTPLQRYLSLLRLAQVELHDPALALHYGADVPMAELSIVGLIMEAAPDMGTALRQLQRYGRLALEVDGGDDGPRFALERSGARLLLVEQRSLGPDRELIEEAFARLVCGPRRFLSERHVLAIHFAHPDPGYRADYERVFECPVYFDARANMLELHPEVGSWPVAQHPRYVFGLLLDRGEVLLADRTKRHSTRLQVEDALRARLHEGDVSADAIAAQLACSRSTLFRRLRDEGTTYSQVADQLRRDLALAYLRAGKLSVRQVAYLVGFSDPAAFSRAFRRWTGRAPGRFRSRAPADA